MRKPVQRPVLTTAPDAPDEAESAVMPSEHALQPSIIERLDAAVRAASVRGDHRAHAALSELHVAAGLLRAKAATRERDLRDDDADLAQAIQAIL